MWTLIEAEDQIPTVGTRESQWLDFKAKAEPNEFEAAKDVAAFANGGGGTLLIGVAGGDSVQKIVGISQVEAREAQSLYELAIRDRCRPVPIVSFEHLRVGSGIVLAVNVRPFPGQIVGVKVKKGEAKCGPKPTEPEDLFYLPLRIGVHTRGITPEQVPMFTDARIRRISAVLEQAVGQPAILIATKVAHAKDIWMEDAKIEKVDPLQNVLVVEVARNKVPIPLDVVDAVCRAEDCWHVYIAGVITSFEGTPRGTSPTANLRVFFNPSGHM